MEPNERYFMPSDPAAAGPSAPPAPVNHGLGSSASRSTIMIAVQIHGTLVYGRSTLLQKIENDLFCKWRDILATTKLLAGLDLGLRNSVSHEYRELYSVDIHEHLNSGLPGRHLKHAALLWMTDPFLRDIDYLKKGLSSNVNSHILIEVMVTRSYAHMQALEHMFSSGEGFSLKNAMEAKGHLGQLLYTYANTPDEQSLIIRREMLVDDARRLYFANRKRPGYDESVYVEIFGQRSSRYLCRLRPIYLVLYMQPLEKEIKMATHGPFKKALLTILLCSQSRAEYFAEMLHKAMAGLFPDHETLARIIVTRAEIDLEEIKAEYQKQFKKTLSDALKKTSLLNSKSFLLQIMDRGQ